MKRPYAIVIAVCLVLAGAGGYVFLDNYLFQPFGNRKKLDQSQSHARKGLALAAAGKYQEAVASYEDALELMPHSITANNNLAWLLATCPDSSIRDGEQALKHALSVDPQWRTWTDADTLAAAYAETGAFQLALNAVDVAIANAPEEALPRLEARKASYTEGKAYREVPPKSP